MAGIYSKGGSAGHRYAGWLETVEAKNFIFGGKVFNGSPSAIYVGSNQVWPWLTIAAQQAIRGAFGQTDGKAVIHATNAYLNQLAASGQAGKDKATALAGFINEVDYMLVCSLVDCGVYRLVKTNDGAYLTLPTAYNTHYTYEAVAAAAAGGWLFGGNAGLAGNGYGLSAGQWRNGNRYVNVPSLSDGVPHNIVADKDGINIDGTYYALPSQSSESTSSNISLHWCTDGSSAAKIGSYAHFRLKDKVGAVLYDLVPIYLNGQAVYMDMNAIGVEGKQLYYPKNSGASGSFTIEYTLPDGTPWTPSTP